MAKKKKKASKRGPQIVRRLGRTSIQLDEGGMNAIEEICRRTGRMQKYVISRGYEWIASRSYEELEQILRSRESGDSAA